MFGSIRASSTPPCSAVTCRAVWLQSHRKRLAFCTAGSGTHRSPRGRRALEASHAPRRAAPSALREREGQPEVTLSGPARGLDDLRGDHLVVLLLVRHLHVIALPQVRELSRGVAVRRERVVLALRRF